MKRHFVVAKDGQFAVNNEPLRLRGFGIGSWMNFEHFMLRIPGSEKRIRGVFTEVYGEDNAKLFFDKLLTSFIGDDDFVFLKSLGVNIIRLAINHQHLEDDQSPGQYIDTGFKHIDRVLGLCKHHNIYAVLDMHTSPGGQNPDTHSGSATGTAEFWNHASLRERLINLWRHIATRYKNEAIIAGFDVLNEPAFVSDKAAFNDFHHRVIQNIRAVDSNHIIFLEGDYWARDFTIFDHLEGEQLAISFHFYPGQHVSIYDETDARDAEMRKLIKVYTDLREQTGLPLWVGETGGIFPANRQQQGHQLVEQCLDLFEENEISWSLWAYKDAQSMSLVYPKNDTPWMEFTKYLRPKWQSKKARAENISKDIFNLLEEKLSYNINPKEREKLSFRISSLLYDLHMDYLVKPKLKSTPWDKIKVLPESFLWQNCDYQHDTANMVKKYTGSI